MFTFIILICLVCAYYYLIKPLNYWKYKKVDHKKPIPIFGNFLPLLTRKYSNIEFYQHIYETFPNNRYVGMYNLHAPVLMIRDPKLYKEIFLDEFETFHNHRVTVPSNVDPYWSNNLFAITDLEKWHRLRTVLSPGFTSGQLRNMFLRIKENARALRTSLLSKEDVVEIDAKEISVKLATEVLVDNIVSINAGLIFNQKSDLKLVIKDLITATGVNGMLFIFKFFPLLLKVTRTTMVSKRVRTFFRAHIKHIIEERKAKDIVGADILQLLIEAQENDFGRGKIDGTNQKRVDYVFKITDDVLLSQILIFLFAGIDTTSTALAYTMYELATNPEIQDRLRGEVDKSINQCNGDITYDGLVQMTYLDMVVSEVLRKHPPFIELNRCSTKPYTIKAVRAGERDLFLEKGSNILYPIRATQWNPKYFPNPERFDPERFSEENRDKIVPYTFNPFGYGARSCIGSRFALLEIKMATVEILKQFTVVQTARTKVPLILNKDDFSPLPNDGIWVGLKKREEYI